MKFRASRRERCRHGEAGGFPVPEARDRLFALSTRRAARVLRREWRDRLARIRMRAPALRVPGVPTPSNRGRTEADAKVSREMAAARGGPFRAHPENPCRAPRQ